MLPRTSIAALVYFCFSVSCSAGTPALGAYVGNSTSELRQFEQWLGRPVDQITAHTGRANWTDWIDSIRWSIDLWSPLNKPICWTIPLFADGGSLADAANGAYDDYYTQAARMLAQTRQSDEAIYVRTGEELNGNWMPWSAAGHEQDFVRAYRRFVEAFRSVSGRFRFEWNVNVRETRMNPADAYPGDDDVDVIGMDFYYNTEWNPTDPVKAWDEMVNSPYGLKWLEDFASAHKKPTAYPEWGINSDTAGPYIEKAARWFSEHNVLYQSVWNSNDAFPGKLSDGQYPDAAAAYVHSFGAPASAPRSPSGAPR
ncbi:glycoside hydrolase family 26 protein [Bradyrhizobium sp. STM 3557]|uniref:glycoside hydrolase family 26 protein n=1 Tax=Bradyrhizobium sp. STM 3557 TaxID=578920 RepID=UPI00388F8F86